MPNKELKNEKEHTIRGILRKDDRTADELFGKIMKMYDEILKISDLEAYAKYNKKIAANEAEWYDRIAEKHERIAQNNRRLMFMNGTVAAVDASLVAYSIVLTSAANEFVIVAAASVGVLASTLTVVTARLSKFNKAIANLRRSEAAKYRLESLPETSEE